MYQVVIFGCIYASYRGSCAVGWCVCLACGRLSVPTPAATQVLKTGSDNSTAKRSAIGVSVTGPPRLPL